MHYWKCHWVRVPDERLHLAITPMACPPGSLVLASALSQMEALFCRQQDLSNLNYSTIVALFLTAIQREGL